MGPPARGVLAGIKQDAQKAKETGAAFDPNSVGSAWYAARPAWQVHVLADPETHQTVLQGPQLPEPGQ